MALPPRLLLHGTIEATISHAENTYDPTRVTGWLPFGIGDAIQAVQEDVLGAGQGRTRLHVEVGLDGARVARTADVVQDPLQTRWNETVRAYCAHTAAEVVFSVMIQQQGAPTFNSQDTPLGRAYLPVRDLLASHGQQVERWFRVLDGSTRRQLTLLGRPCRLYLRIKFVHAAASTAGAGPGPGVAHTFFPQRPGSRVILYQDAHAPASFAPRIPLAGGGQYEPGRCWEDVFDAISNARHLVYIAGWSVYTKITLVRDAAARPRPAGGYATTTTLGDLLARKAREGVRVLLLVWDDPSSTQVLHEWAGIKWSMMSTHDEDTAAFFRRTGVHCVLVPRNTVIVPAFHPGVTCPTHELISVDTHHQKTVVVDHEMPLPQSSSSSSLRHIVSFVGGLDLCDGRYDTQSHSLFRTLGTEHREDFHQPNLAGAAAGMGGPREPWHDIHCRIEGPAAWDVLCNFEQRWKKQGGSSNGGLLVDLDALQRRGLLMPPSWQVTPPGDIETWNVQVFRSIDNISIVGFPTDSTENMDTRLNAGLICGRNHVIERSIQDAYILAIRRAKSFIYIENQFFIGSSFEWKPGSINPRDAAPTNLIPRELSLKIASKIDAGERFTVYVVLPMWSEGPPESGSVQEILYWQRRTMEMMYADVAAALRRKKVPGANPRDYLTFFCLGNREVKSSSGGDYQPAGAPPIGTPFARAQKARRFMIYVHSKMMIVDDEYIIVGSANINQRSMDGARDTEIAMGAYQPHHPNTNRGQVHGFRMSLWYEHLGGKNDKDFLDPASLACVQKVNRMAEDNWRLYAQDALLQHDLPGHLLAYPITVSDDGEVEDGVEYFPDTQAPVRGKTDRFLAAYYTA